MKDKRKKLYWQGIIFLAIGVILLIATSVRRQSYGKAYGVVTEVKTVGHTLHSTVVYQVDGKEYKMTAPSGLFTLDEENTSIVYYKKDAPWSADSFKFFWGPTLMFLGCGGFLILVARFGSDEDVS